MTYKIAVTQPRKRDPSLDWEETGPGLYDDGEVLVEIEDIFAAVSFTTTWLDNGAGISIKGTARWCNPDGSTHITPQGKHVEAYGSLTCNPLIVEQFGVEALTKEVLLAMMGQPPELMEGENAVVAFSPELRLNMSILAAANTVKSTREVPSTASILGS